MLPTFPGYLWPFRVFKVFVFLSVKQTAVKNRNGMEMKLHLCFFPNFLSHCSPPVLIYLFQYFFLGIFLEGVCKFKKYLWCNFIFSLWIILIMEKLWPSHYALNCIIAFKTVFLLPQVTQAIFVIAAFMQCNAWYPRNRLISLLLNSLK